jgi:protein SCO1/2
MRRGARSSAARLTAWILLVWAVALGVGLAAAAPKRWGADYFPNVPLITQDGKTVRFYDDLLKDKVVAINFIYTSCTDVCPGETARLRQVQKLLEDRVGRDIFMYSISIDPETDTPEVLKEYAEKFRVGPGWLFLTGKEADITLLQRKLGLLIEDLEDPQDHNVSLLVGNEATGRWMKRSPYDNPLILAGLLADDLHNWKVAREGRRSYTEARLLDKFSRGEYLFRTRCTACHSVGGGDGIGPDLLGVTQKRDPVWLARWLQVPDQMLAEKDPLAMQLYAKYREVPMPNLSLNDVEVQALVDYMQRESLRVEQASSSDGSGAHAHKHH